MGRENRGFTLAESLVVVLLLSMVSGAMAAGTAYALHHYRAAMASSQANILCSTLRAAVNTELSNGRAFRLEDGTLVSFVSQNYGQAAQAEGFSCTDGKLRLNGMLLAGEGAYVRGLTAKLYPITFDGTAFRVRLEILGQDGAVLASSSFEVRPLNPSELKE